VQSRGFLAPTHAKHVLLGCFATTGPLRVPSPTDHGALTRFARAIPWLSCSNTCKACVAWLLRNHGSASRPESYGPRGPHSLRSCNPVAYLLQHMQSMCCLVASQPRVRFASRVLRTTGPSLASLGYRFLRNRYSTIPSLQARRWPCARGHGYHFP